MILLRLMVVTRTGSERNKRETFLDNAAAGLLNSIHFAASTTSQGPTIDIPVQPLAGWQYLLGALARQTVLRTHNDVGAA